MEAYRLERTLDIFGVANTHKLIDLHRQAQGHGKFVKPRQSVDLERMFFGEQDGVSEDGKKDDGKEEEKRAIGPSVEEREIATILEEEESHVTSANGSRSVPEVQHTEGHVGDGSTPGQTLDTEHKIPATPEHVTFKGASQMMARLYARLSELRSNKTDDDTATMTSSETVRHRDRRRIKTALRRLLTERLFPDQRPADAGQRTDDHDGAESEPQVKDDPLASGTVTPMTVGSRSRTAINMRSRTDLEPQDGTQSGMKGRVVFVGGNSHLTESETDGDGGRTAKSHSARDENEETPGYYRRHLGPVRNPSNISRLYQPPRSPSNLTKGTRDGVTRDQAFLDRLNQERRALEEMLSTPNGDKSPIGESRSPARDAKGGNRPKVNWTYNYQQGPGTSPGNRKLRDLEDWQLKNLLQELYQDKKYMDRVINTHSGNDVEEGVAVSLEQGRDYLLQRALFWLEQGPAPPRPPTTELGLRLEREQSLLSVRSHTPVASPLHKGGNPQQGRGPRAKSSLSDLPSVDRKDPSPETCEGR